MGLLGRTFAITRASARALATNPRLLVFPLLSGLACLAIIASFIAPVAIAVAGNPGELPGWLTSILAYLGTFGDHGLTIKPLGYLALFGFYFVLYFVAIFFNVAMTREALRSLRGEPTSVLGGIGFALTRLPAILSFTAIASTIGLLLRSIEERVGLIGKFVTGLLGVAWSMVSFLVFPVMVQEQRGGFAAVKRSAALFKKTWGETALGELGIGLLAILAFLAASAGLIAVAAAIKGLAAVLIVCIGGPFLLIAMLVAVSALRAMYRAALYIWAAEGVIVEHFEIPALATVWTVKSADPS